VLLLVVTPYRGVWSAADCTILRGMARVTASTESRDGRRGRLRRQDWVDAARKRLAESGVEAVRIAPLARDLGVTKGSFYWHFKDRGELLDALLDEWEATTDRVAASVPEAATPAERMERFLAAVTSTAADPEEAAVENAVLAWAQNDPAVAERVAAVERRRTVNAERLLVELGFPPAEAASWADIGYMTYVGMTSRSSRDPRFREWPQSDYLGTVVRAAQALIERPAPGRQRGQSWSS
jgi:AcrR family transcriptional regulator